MPSFGGSANSDCAELILPDAPRGCHDSKRYQQWILFFTNTRTTVQI